jgi:hypothetical protein
MSTEDSVRLEQELNARGYYIVTNYQDEYTPPSMARESILLNAGTIEFEYASTPESQHCLGIRRQFAHALFGKPTRIFFDPTNQRVAYLATINPMDSTVDIGHGVEFWYQINIPTFLAEINNICGIPLPTATRSDRLHAIVHGALQRLCLEAPPMVAGPK